MYVIKHRWSCLMPQQYYSSNHMIWYRIHSHIFSYLLHIIYPDYMLLISSRDSIAGAMTVLRPGIGLSFQARARQFCLPQTDQTGCGAGQTCYSLAPEALSPVREAEYSTVSSVEVKMGRAVPSRLLKGYLHLGTCIWLFYVRALCLYGHFSHLCAS